MRPLRKATDELGECEKGDAILAGRVKGHSLLWSRGAPSARAGKHLRVSCWRLPEPAEA